MEKIFKIFTVIIFCISSSLCMGQRYDHIRLNTKDCDFDTVIGDNIYFYRNIYKTYEYSKTSNYKLRHPKIINFRDSTYYLYRYFDRGIVRYYKSPYPAESLSITKSIVVKDDLVGKELTYYMPIVVYNGYRAGDIRCKAGWVCLSVGAATVITGRILKQTTNEKYGDYLTIVGGSIFGVSIPLLVFGDHIKRESNMYNELFKRYDEKDN